MHDSIRPIQLTVALGLTRTTNEMIFLPTMASDFPVEIIRSLHNTANWTLHTKSPRNYQHFTFLMKHTHKEKCLSETQPFVGKVHNHRIHLLQTGSKIPDNLFLSKEQARHSVNMGKTERVASDAEIIKLMTSQTIR